jgi:hypothetical protein
MSDKSDSFLKVLKHMERLTLRELRHMRTWVDARIESECGKAAVEFHKKLQEHNRLRNELPSWVDIMSERLAKTDIGRETLARVQRKYGEKPEGFQYKDDAVTHEGKEYTTPLWYDDTRARKAVADAMLSGKAKPYKLKKVPEFAKSKKVRGKRK